MSKKHYKLIFLIPVLEEKENLDILIKSISDSGMPGTDYIVLFIITLVKSLASDKTLEKIEEYSRNNKNIFLITNTRRGLGRAYIQGFRYLLENFHFDYVCTMDADGSHSPKYIRKMLSKSSLADVINASRYIDKSKGIKWNIIRHRGSIIVNSLIKFFVPSHIYDFTSGFRLYSSKILRELDFTSLKSRGFVFQVEILFKILNIRGVLLEMPYYFKERTKGISKFRLVDVLEYSYIASPLLLIWFIRKCKLAVKKAIWHFQLVKRILVIKFFYDYSKDKDPYRIMLSVTNNCNFECATCGIWQNKNKKNLEIGNIKKIFNKYGQRLLLLTITGGEPFWDKDHLIDSINSIKEKSPNLYYISINTNGYFTDSIFYTVNFLLQKNIFLKLYLGVSYIPNISWGYGRTGRKDAFHKMTNTLKVLDKLKHRYGRRLNYYKIYTVNSKEDFQYVEKIDDDLWINFAEISGFYNNLNFKNIAQLNSEDKLSFIERFYKENKNSLSFFNKRYLLVMKKILEEGCRGVNCYAGKNRLYFDCQGRDYICSRGVKERKEITSRNYNLCWTPCEAVFDIMQNIFI